MVANTTYYDLIVIVTLNHFRIMTLVEGQHAGTPSGGAQDAFRQSSRRSRSEFVEDRLGQAWQKREPTWFGRPTYQGTFVRSKGVWSDHVIETFVRLGHVDQVGRVPWHLTRSSDPKFVLFDRCEHVLIDDGNVLSLASQPVARSSFFSHNRSSRNSKLNQI